MKRDPLENDDFYKCLTGHTQIRFENPFKRYPFVVIVASSGTMNFVRYVVRRQTTLLRRLVYYLRYLRTLFVPSLINF